MLLNWALGDRRAGFDIDAAFKRVLRNLLKWNLLNVWLMLNSNLSCIEELDWAHGAWINATSWSFWIKTGTWVNLARTVLYSVLVAIYLANKLIRACGQVLRHDFLRVSNTLSADVMYIKLLVLWSLQIILLLLFFSNLSMRDKWLGLSLVECSVGCLVMSYWTLSDYQFRFLVDWSSSESRL